MEQLDLKPCPSREDVVNTFHSFRQRLEWHMFSFTRLRRLTHYPNQFPMYLTEEVREGDKLISIRYDFPDPFTLAQNWQWGVGILPVVYTAVGYVRQGVLFVPRVEEKLTHQIFTYA